jgi:hypothetical protein
MGTRYISHRRDRKDIERAARDQAAQFVSRTPPSVGTRLLAVSFIFVELGKLLMKIANGRVVRLRCHPAALRSAFQIGTRGHLYGHRPSASGICP